MVLKSPPYNSYCFIFYGEQIIGYAHTDKEADAICKRDRRYIWDYNNFIKNKTKRVKLYNSLPQIIYTNNKILHSNQYYVLLLKIK